MALQTPRNPSRLALIALLALSLAACTSASESGREGGGGESGSEHGQGAEGSEGGGGEGSGEHGGGGEGSEGSGGDGEESAVQLSPTQTFWMTRKGVRLDLRYDAATRSFRGSATNITGAPIPRVRVEVHLSNGVELGPTTTMDLAPGQTVDVTLPATGQTFAQWGAHAESDGPAQMPAFTPSLGAWAVVDGVPLGIEHPTHRMSAWYASSSGAWTPHLSPDPAPQHQPTGAATWTGEWAGVHGSGSTVSTGAANVTVTLGAITEADLTLQGVPTLGTLRWNDMQVTDGRFTGSTAANSNTYDAVGQFGGANQAGVVGHATGPDFRSVFYGNKN